MGAKKYELILFGVTGFTGQLAVEYILQNYPDLSWAASARNAAKAELTLKRIAAKCGIEKPPPLMEVDLTDYASLLPIIRQTRVVLTCAGPFEKYGQGLVRCCAEEGVHYADITGETDFVRQMIQKYDGTARSTGSAILVHCGADCIPQSLMVYEMNSYATKELGELTQVQTYVELAESTRMSGGTAATAVYQLSKDRTRQADKPTFDPLLQSADGSKSDYATKNISPKTDISVLDGKRAGPWIMAPVMVNAVRRANALLHYSKHLKYGDALVAGSSTSFGYLKDKLLLGSALILPTFISKRFLPQPGEGPDRQAMERGYCFLHARGEMKASGGETVNLEGTFRFNKDISYLYTAALLVETGMLLVASQNGTLCGGVQTPEVALGHTLTERILDKLETSLEIKPIEP